MRNKHQTNDGARRGGFTLMEMLIVIAIIAILAAITVTAIYATANSDRIRGAARQMQSAMQGAMAKAARAKKPIGVRLQLDEFDPTTVSSMIFIEQLDDFQDGPITFVKIVDTDPEFRFIRDDGASPSWQVLRDNGQLPDVTRIKIIETTGNEKIYIVNTTETGTGGANVGQLQIISSADFGDADVIVQNPGMLNESLQIDPDSEGNARYKLEMGNGPLANQDALELPNGNVIDLFYSSLPLEWFEDEVVTAATPPPGTDLVADLGGGDLQVRRYGVNNTNRPVQMDIMFSPRGVVAGPLAAAGKIHLMLAEIEDTIPNRPPELAEGENIITSIYTNTGKVEASPVFKTASPPEYYNFAETGEVAGR